MILVTQEQCGFVGVRNIISVILRLQDFVTTRPCPISFMFSMPEDLYVRLKLGTPIAVPSSPENDDVPAVLS
jgi:hypothetical protein